jgi:ubiquinone/menaquinone biosynthesis C-methylase UbiE
MVTTERGRTDYEQIASRYDEDRQHVRTPTDVGLTQLFESGAEHVKLLDIGCGTGRYLETQVDYFRGRTLQCFGVDLSPAMLSAARLKLPRGNLVCARAEQLPFRDDSFDYVFSGWAFHHFVDKRSAVKEVARILRPEGRFTLQNIDPWSMPRWWVYLLFEGTWEADQGRFWTVETLTEELQRQGLSVTMTIDHAVASLRAADLLARAEARVMSQFAILDEARYREGVRRLRAKTVADPEATIESESASLTMTAMRQGGCASAAGLSPAARGS